MSQKPKTYYRMGNKLQQTFQYYAERFTKEKNKSYCKKTRGGDEKGPQTKSRTVVINCPVTQPKNHSANDLFHPGLNTRNLANRKPSYIHLLQRTAAG